MEGQGEPIANGASRRQKQPKQALSASTVDATDPTTNTPAVSLLSDNGRAERRKDARKNAGTRDPADPLSEAAAAPGEAPPARPSKLVQQLRSNVGSTIIAANFLSNCWSSAWKDRGAWKHRLAPLEALHRFLATTGIDREVLAHSASLQDRNKFITNLRILAHCHKVMVPRLRRRIGSVRATEADDAAPRSAIVRDVAQFRRYMRYSTAVYGPSMIQAAKVELGQSALLWNLSASEKHAAAEHIGIRTDDVVLLHEQQRNGPPVTSNRQQEQQPSTTASSAEETTPSQSIDKSILPKDLPALFAPDNDEDEDGQDDNVYDQRSENTLTLRHMVAVDHQHKAVVVAIRGTYSVQELLIDMGGFTKPFCYGEGHSEIISMIENVWQTSGETIVSQLEKFPKYDLVLTGHSLGGCSAALLHVWLQSTILVRRDTSSVNSDTNTDDGTHEAQVMAVPKLRPPLPEHMHVSHRIRCYSFGGLPVYCAPDKEDYAKHTHMRDEQWLEVEQYHSAMSKILKETSVNVVYRYDYAPFVSIDLIRRLLYQVRTVDDYYERLATNKKTDWMFHTQRWWTRQQVAQGWQIARPPDDLIEALREQPSVPRKEGAPSLWTPVGYIVWIHEDDDDCDGTAPGDNKSTDYDNADWDASGRQPEMKVSGSYAAAICDPARMTSDLGFFLHPQTFLDHLPSRYETSLQHMEHAS